MSSPEPCGRILESKHLWDIFQLTVSLRYTLSGFSSVDLQRRNSDENRKLMLKKNAAVINLSNSGLDLTEGQNLITNLSSVRSEMSLKFIKSS